MDMSKYSGVQNYQLFKQIQDEERRRNGEYVPMEPQAEVDVQAWKTPEQRAVEAMSKTQSTNFFTHMNKVAQGKISAFQMKNPARSQWEEMSEEDQSKVTSTNLYNMFRTVEEGTKNEI